MQQIRCPHCGEVFTIDESNYNSIVKQIRDHEFAEELRNRENEIREHMEAEIRLIRTQSEYQYKEKLNEREKELDDLRNQLKIAQNRTDSAVRETAAIKEKEAADTVADLKSQIAVLHQNIDAKETEKKLAVEQAIARVRENKDDEIRGYLVQIDTLKSEAVLKEQSMQASYNEMVAAKDKEIASQQELVKQYKDFKARQSTKMVGESLEQHCAYEFNRLRMGMFPRAYFEKDNDARTGSKGDFIFRDYDEEGTEIISIMFEMKNENETTATKHKNEDFLKELDKDRREKNCEYAVLVSLLEADSDLYNEGIVDVSYRYPKMYVVRPQFFIPIITILRNAALNSLGYKKQLMIERNNNLDVTHFEENMNAFKAAFGRNYDLASRKFQKAIEEIDKTIAHLQKTKEELLSSENNLRLANNKAQELSIKKLTKDAPSVAERFEELKKEQ